MPNLLLDLKQALRSLLKAPGFTLAVLLTLALGIGANASIFSLMDQALWRPLPFKDPEALVITRGIFLGNGNSIPLSAPDFLDLRAQTQSFTGLAGFRQESLNLGGDAHPEVLQGARVSANFFDVLGVQPRLGRTFASEEERDGAHRVVVLSHELWERRFGQDSAVLGRSLRLNGEAWQVVGVLPQGFRFPFGLGNRDLYFPMAFSPRERAPEARGVRFFSSVGRLKPGLGPEAASQDLARVAAGLASAFPGPCENISAGARSLKRAALGDKRQGQLWMLMGVAGLVLLIACVNVASLLLARGISRRQELAIRAALGADRRLLVRQLMSESLVLGLAGGALGLLASTWISAGLVQVVNLPVDVSATLGLRPFLIMGLSTLLACVLFGALPAWQATRGNLVQGLREGAKGTASPGTHRLRSALVVAEVAMATALMVATGLGLRSLWRLQSLPLGFDPKDLITGSLKPPEPGPGGDAKLRAFTEALVHRLEAAPGVASAAITDTLPMSGSTSTSIYEVEGEPIQPRNQSAGAYFHRTTPQYFRTLRIPLKEGRDFHWGEGPSCIVSESFAHAHFPGRSALGHRVRTDSDAPWWEIVGVVATTEQEAPGQTRLPHLYVPMQGHTGNAPLQVVARAEGEAKGIKGLLPAASVALDPDLPMDRVRPVEDFVRESLGDDRTQGALMASFAAAALLLALVGIYGLMSFVARSRTREMGIRAALGATLTDLIALILGEGSRLVALGLGLGLLSAALLGRGIASQFQGLSGWDLGTYVAVTGLLGCSALLACLFPALRAARVDPAVALRSE